MFFALLLILNSYGTAIATDTPFIAHMRLYKPLVISEVEALAFPKVISGSTEDLVVGSSGDSAAKFDLAGNANTDMVAGIIENSVTVSAPNVPKPVVVDSFTVRAPLALNDSGRGTISVGATAHIDGYSEEGNYYISSGTLRVVYQ